MTHSSAASTLEAPGTWITLTQALQFAARLGGVDERLVTLMASDTWARVARRSWESRYLPSADRKAAQEAWVGKAPEKLQALRRQEVNADETLIQRMAQLSEAELAQRLGKAKDLLNSLRAILAAGKVAGEGSHVPPGPVQPVAPITEREWGTLYVHFWMNELQPRSSNEGHFPRIVDVRVRTEDVRRGIEENFPRPPRTLNEKKRAAVIAAIRHFGVEALYRLGQKGREVEIIAFVKKESDLTVSDRYVRDHLLEAVRNIRRS